MGSAFRAIGQSPTRNALVSEIRRDCKELAGVGWDDCAIETAFYPNLSAWIKASGCPMVAEANELFPLPIATRSEIVHQAKRGRARGEEAGVSGCGRGTKSVARIQKRSSRRSVTPAA